MNKEKINQIKKSIKDKQQELRTFCQEEFKKGTEELFDENLELKSFGFSGWVPYFNDGDECTFCAHTDEPDINDIDGYDLAYGEETKNLEKLQSKVSDFLSTFDDNFYQELFGSHFKVKITRSKIQTEEYTEHD